MSVIDILTRVDAICKKYDKYDIEKQKDSNIAGDDAFARLYAAVASDIEAALQKAETASQEKSRASAVAINAEIRRTKARLLGEVPKLQRLAIKKLKAHFVDFLMPAFTFNVNQFTRFLCGTLLNSLYVGNKLMDLDLVIEAEMVAMHLANP
ncbi:unnamed protein product [Fraxinus pennsylvanica]|uniref:Uncharacterized protein n=1 Tax=Fraxinus pennsylvanica TaxID=56036 RepID=A0AAD2DW24_9LAMI|nr:unnamed protein product [Fraxinus pennsylvanica]